MSNLISGQMNRFRSELSQAISAKTAAPLNALAGSTASFGGLEQEVAKRIELGDDLLAGGKAGGSGGKPRLPGGLKLPF